ncbi:MAG: Hsp70 family protein [Proteobacteria bacterium]|jgi:molecular chaperone DnaK|nr:Hsp70 family protein [Pseudomonadota bacterium]
MAKAIGIDLGTTNSCAAVFLDGKPQVITFRDGARTIPSVFAIDKSGRAIVGKDAVDQAADNPTNTVMASKRLLGRTFSGPAIDKMNQVFTYEFVEGASSEVLVKVSEQVFTLEQISAAILGRIKEQAEEVLLDDVEEAVITVPAYFNDRQRQSVRTAAKMAGLKVLRVLNEPTAACLAYGLGRKLNQRVAIYDLGGGTFDISIIDIKDRVFETIAIHGDPFLGGVDFDDRVMQWILKEFLEETKIDVSYDRSSVMRIREAAENAKIELSTSLKTEIFLPNIGVDDSGKQLSLKMEFSRQKLEELTGDLVDRSIVNSERTFVEADITRDQIDEILLVGGQSRMPLVRAKVQQFLGMAPSQKINPDEAVAIGASIMANTLASQTDGKSRITLMDVLPMAIGIKKPDGTMHVLFAKNQPLPDYKTRILTSSKDSQRSFLLRIYQGESDRAEANELLGMFVFAGLPPGPAGSAKIEVTFHIDSEGILNLSGRDTKTGELVESRMKLNKPQGKRKVRKIRKKKPVKAPPEIPTLPVLSSPSLSPLNVPKTSLKPSNGEIPPPTEDEQPLQPKTQSSLGCLIALFWSIFYRSP